MIRRVLLLMVACLVVMVGSGRADAALSAEDARSTLDAASENFRKGTTLLESDREAARTALVGAIEGYERLIRDGGYQSGGLFYNIGTAHLMLGDVGRAILNFRRAERYSPNDANLAANLALARQRVASRIDAPGDERLRRVLLFWHDETSPASRMSVFIGAYALAWGWAFLRLLRPSIIGGWWPVLGLGVISASCLASLIVQERAERSRSDAVIVAAQSIGRKGPDVAAYEPTFKEPLRAGVEFEIIERRPGWVLARLADRRTTWLPEADSEALSPIVR